MKAYLVSKYKSPMQAGEVAEPAVDDRDVLVDVHAAGVNMLDAKIRDGEFKLFLPYKAPFILGHDLAGVVARGGSAVTRFTVGDGVYAPAGPRLRPPARSPPSAAPGHDPAEPEDAPSGARHGVRYSFPFMRASGAQLDEITKLIDTNVLRPSSTGRIRSTRPASPRPRRTRPDQGQGRHHDGLTRNPCGSPAPRRSAPPGL
jgi:hypothetical protein